MTKRELESFSVKNDSRVTELNFVSEQLSFEREAKVSLTETQPSFHRFLESLNGVSESEDVGDLPVVDGRGEMDVRLDEELNPSRTEGLGPGLWWVYIEALGLCLSNKTFEVGWLCQEEHELLGWHVRECFLDTFELLDPMFEEHELRVCLQELLIELGGLSLEPGVDGSYKILETDVEPSKVQNVEERLSAEIQEGLGVGANDGERLLS